MPIKPTAAGGFEISVCVNYRRVHRRLAPGTSTGEAKRVEAELRIALGKQRAPLVPGDPPLAELLALYLEHAKGLRSPDTARFHALRIGEWVAGFNASQARQVAASIVRDMTGHYAAATINRSLGALKKALGLAWQSGRTPIDYSSLVRRIPENNERTTRLSIEQVGSLTSHASEAVAAAIWIALYTGCRRGEICKLQPADVAHDHIRVLAGNTKTLRYREVPIVASLRPWLQHLPLAVNFEGLKSGFRRAREAARMPHVTFHDLRRSCATILLQSGADLHTVSKILGHSSTAVTERRYAYLAGAQMAAAMDRAFAPPVTPEATRSKRRG